MIVESSQDIRFSNNESIAITSLFKFWLEDYRDSLLEDCKIYEAYLNGDNTILEGFNLKDTIKEITTSGKKKALEIYQSTKKKVKEVGDIIKDLADKAIKTVRDMAKRLLQTLDSLKCSISDLFKKSGENVEQSEKEWMQSAQELAEKVKNGASKDIKNSGIYESFGNQLRSMIFEDDEQSSDGSKTISQSGGKDTTKKGKIKSMVWKGLKQFMLYALVCILIPGIVCAVFPGTFIALLVPIVARIGWNIRKIPQIYKQIRNFIKDYKTLTKVQKAFHIITLTLSIVGLVINFGTTLDKLGPVISGFVTSGKGLFEAANIGVEPDILTKITAATIRGLGNKMSGGEFNFSEQMQFIQESFAKHVTSTVDKVIKTTAKFGQTGKEVLDQYQGQKFHSSSEVWNKFLNKVSMDPSSVKPTGTYDIVLDGHHDASWYSRLADAVKQCHGSMEYSDAMNKGLNHMCSNAGSLTGVRIDGATLVKLLKDHPDWLGNKGLFAILGGTSEVLTHATTTIDVVQAATSMLPVIPIINVSPKNYGGFRIKLGDEKSKNYVYEIGEDGIKEEDFKKSDEGYKELENSSKEYYKKIHDQASKKEVKESEDDSSSSDEDQQKQVEDAAQKFNDNYKDSVEKTKKVVFYGKKVEDKESSDESYMSLRDYLLINEDEDKPKDDDKPENDDNAEDDDKVEDDDKNVKVLEFLPWLIGHDLADANDKGPRKDPYSFKGCMIDPLSVILIKKGTSLDDIEETFGTILYGLVNNCYNLLADKPCVKEEDDKKWKVNENSSYQPDDERPEIGDFTNNEITDIMNNKDHAKNYLAVLGKNMKIVKDDEDSKKQKENVLKKNKEAIKNDQDVRDKMAKIASKNNDKIYDKDGKINDDELNKFIDNLAEWQVGQHRRSQSKGFFGRMWDKIKSFFGYDTSDFKKANSLVSNYYKKNKNESLISRMSLKDYIKINS